jgi:hypothetical protein
LEVDILKVGNLEVDILKVGNLEVDILKVGNLEVDIFDVAPYYQTEDWGEKDGRHDGDEGPFQGIRHLDEEVLQSIS